MAAELLTGTIRVEVGKTRLLETRQKVERGWQAVGDILMSEGQLELAAQVKRFIDQMPPPQTDKERLATELIVRTRETRTASRSPSL